MWHLAVLGACVIAVPLSDVTVRIAPIIEAGNPNQVANQESLMRLAEIFAKEPEAAGGAVKKHKDDILAFDNDPLKDLGLGEGPDLAAEDEDLVHMREEIERDDRTLHDVDKQMHSSFKEKQRPEEKAKELDSKIKDLKKQLKKLEAERAQIGQKGRSKK